MIVLASARWREPFKGFTLLEVMVAMVIVAVSFLGLLSLQVSALRFLQTASNEGRAAILAHNLAERIKANPEGAIYPGAYEHDIGDPGKGVAAPDCEAHACTAEQLADFDMAEWLALGHESLPGFAGGTVSRVVNEGAGLSNAHEFIITLYWNEGRPREHSMPCAVSGFELYSCWQMRLGVR